MVVPLAIPRYPLPGILASLVLDAADQTIFQLAGGIDPSSYQTYDKALDVYYLTIAYAATIRNWDGGPAFVIGRALWYYRLVGVVLFEHFEARWLLLVFPNTFEYFFIAVELMKVSRNPFALSRNQLLAIAAAIWVCIKLPQEWWLHVAQLDVTDVAAALISERPSVAAAIACGALLTAALLRRAAGLLPPRDWAPTLSADQQGEELGWPDPPEAMPPSAFFGWAFVEKAALVTLVTLIFVEILPGESRSVAQVAVATAAIIALNTLFSQWLARRGLTWRSALLELAAMTAANAGIAVVATGLVLPGRGGHTPLPTFLFLVWLLTLIVVLFDRFRVIDRRRPQFSRS
jgi:hypothetical protein